MHVLFLIIMFTYWLLPEPHRCTRSTLNLLFSIDFDVEVGGGVAWSCQLHRSVVQLHVDAVDGRDAVHFLASHLDVEVVDAVRHHLGQDVVAGGGQVEHDSIEGLPVVVSPGYAHLVDGNGICCNNISAVKRHFSQIKTAADLSASPLFTDVLWLHADCVHTLLSGWLRILMWNPRSQVHITESSQVQDAPGCTVCCTYLKPLDIFGHETLHEKSMR